MTTNPAIAANRDIVRRHLLEGVSSHRPDVWDEIMHADFVMHVGLAHGVVRTRKGYQRALAGYWAAFPDLTIELLRLVAEDDIVAAHYVERGTQDGPFGTHPPSGRHYEKNGLGLYRLADAQLVEAWIQEDDHGFARQLALEDF